MAAPGMSGSYKRPAFLRYGAQIQICASSWSLRKDPGSSDRLQSVQESRCLRPRLQRSLKLDSIYKYGGREVQLKGRSSKQL